MTLAERLHKEGFDKGIQQGLEQGLQKGMLQQSREAVIDILEMRFEIIPRSILVIINEINEPLILKTLHKKAVTVKSLDEFRHLIDLIMK